MQFVRLVLFDYQLFIKELVKLRKPTKNYYHTLTAQTTMDKKRNVQFYIIQEKHKSFNIQYPSKSFQYRSKTIKRQFYESPPNPGGFFYALLCFFIYAIHLLYDKRAAFYCL